MKSSTYLDTFNIFEITKPGAFVFNKGEMAESLILNDTTYISLFNMEHTLNNLLELLGKNNLIYLLENGIIKFTFDWIPIDLKELHKEDDKACKIALREYDQDIEEEIDQCVNKIISNSKDANKIIRLIKNDIRIIRYKDINTNELHLFLQENLNTPEVLYNIIKVNRPFYFNLESWEDKQCNVTIKDDGSIYLDNLKHDSDIKEIKAAIGSTFLTTLIRVYICILASESCNCRSLWGNAGLRAFYTAKGAKILERQENEKLHKLIEINNCIDIVDMVNVNKCSSKEILKIRNQMEKVRDLINNCTENTDLEIAEEYLKVINKENKALYNNKSLWFILGLISPVFSAFDTYLKDVIVKNTVRTIRIDNILKKK